MHEKLIY